MADTQETRARAMIIRQSASELSRLCCGARFPLGSCRCVSSNMGVRGMGARKPCLGIKRARDVPVNNRKVCRQTCQQLCLRSSSGICLASLR